MVSLPWPYAPPSWRLARQIFADAAVILWVLLCWGAAAITVQSVKALAGPAVSAGERLGDLHHTLDDTARNISSVPWVGDQLSQPFEHLGGQVQRLQEGTEAQVEAIYSTAHTLGWVVFLIPVCAVLLLWLPWRLRYVRAAWRLRQFQETAQSRDLLALRALSAAPLKQLKKISANPLAEWQAGNREVIDALAALESRRQGVRFSVKNFRDDQLPG